MPKYKFHLRLGLHARFCYCTSLHCSWLHKISSKGSDGKVLDSVSAWIHIKHFSHKIEILQYKVLQSYGWEDLRKPFRRKVFCVTDRLGNREGEHTSFQWKHVNSCSETTQQSYSPMTVTSKKRLLQFVFLLFAIWQTNRDLKRPHISFFFKRRIVLFPWWRNRRGEFAVPPKNLSQADSAQCHLLTPGLVFLFVGTFPRRSCFRFHGEHLGQTNTLRISGR